MPPKCNLTAQQWKGLKEEMKTAKKMADEAAKKRKQLANEGGDDKDKMAYESLDNIGWWTITECDDFLSEVLDDEESAEELKALLKERVGTKRKRTLEMTKGWELREEEKRDEETKEENT